MLQLLRDSKMQSTTCIKKRTQLKQIRLHLNAGITRTGYDLLNDIFVNGYISKDIKYAGILIDGLMDDFVKLQQYQIIGQRSEREDVEFRQLDFDIKNINKRIAKLTAQLSHNPNNDRLIHERRTFGEEKERCVRRRVELFQIRQDRGESRMRDPKRNPKWDLRLMTDWGQVWKYWPGIHTF